MICWHRWTVLEKTEHPSAAEAAAKTGQVFQKTFGCSPAELYGRPVIVTYRCSKCGAEKVERV